MFSTKTKTAAKTIKATTRGAIPAPPADLVPFTQEAPQYSTKARLSADEVETFKTFKSTLPGYR